MNIDTLVESFYSKKDETESIINEVLTLLVGEVQAEALIREQREPITLSYDGVPDIPISEIPWSSVKTLEGGAEVPSPQRKQLEQFLDDIAGDDLKDKVEGLARFYETDPVQLLEQGFFGDSNKERISKALGYLTFYKTLTKIIAHFNASSAGFSFEAFLGVLLGGKQVPTGEGTIADLVTGDGTPVSLKLYTEGSLKVGGSFTDLVNDLRKFEKMQYVAVTKRLNDEKTAGRLDFYRFDFTLDNVGNIMLNGGLENPELMKLPTGFVENPTGFEDIEIYENELLEYATSKLNQVPDLKIYGQAEKKTSVISFNVGSIHSYDIGTILDKYGIAVRTGQHCAQPVMDYFRISGTVRASFAFYNTKKEIDYFCESLNKAIAMLS